MKKIGLPDDISAIVSHSDVMLSILDVFVEEICEIYPGKQTGERRENGLQAYVNSLNSIVTF